MGDRNERRRNEQRKERAWGKFVQKMQNKKRHQLPEHREKNLQAMRCPERKEADKRRLGTEEEKRKTRLRKAGPDALAAHRAWHARRVASSKLRIL